MKGKNIGRYFLPGNQDKKILFNHWRTKKSEENHYKKRPKEFVWDIKEKVFKVIMSTEQKNYFESIAKIKEIWLIAVESRKNVNN